MTNMANTEPSLIEFPKIQSFSNLVSNIKRTYKDDLTLPIVTYTGKVKSHGTNGSVVFKSDNTFYCQSRGRVITPLSDNAGFATWVYRNIDTIKQTLNLSVHPDDLAINKTIVIYGEWCGGNIQSGVVLNQLPKMFIIFAIRYDMDGIEEWSGPSPVWQFNNLAKYMNPDINLYNVDLFKQYDLTIDFNNVHLIQNQIVEITEEVENECPIGSYFGVKGCGEGLVLSCQQSQTETELYTWKSKGLLHANGSKVKTVKTIDPDSYSKIEKLVHKITPVWRLEQGLQEVFNLLNGGELDKKLIGQYVQWVVKDTVNEELNVIVDNKFTVKDVSGEIVKVAKKYYFLKEKELLNII